MGLFKKQYEISYNPNAPKRVKIEYMCTHCGQKVVRTEISGRPMPGKCPKRTGNQPHRWVISRKY